MIRIGDAATVELVVGEDDTAIAMGSGDVPVLATPRVIALVEAAAVAAVVGGLPAGRTTVGTEVALRHLAPSPVGAEVIATATVTKVEGRTVSFAVAVVEETTTVAEGTHTRVVVDRERFLARLG